MSLEKETLDIFQLVTTDKQWNLKTDRKDFLNRLGKIVEPIVLDEEEQKIELVQIERVVAILKEVISKYNDKELVNAGIEYISRVLVIKYTRVSGIEKIGVVELFLNIVTKILKVVLAAQKNKHSESVAYQKVLITACENTNSVINALLLYGMIDNEGERTSNNTGMLIWSLTGINNVVSDCTDECIGGCLVGLIKLVSQVLVSNKAIQMTAGSTEMDNEQENQEKKIIEVGSDLIESVAKVFCEEKYKRAIFLPNSQDTCNIYKKVCQKLLDLNKGLNKYYNSNAIKLKNTVANVLFSLVKNNEQSLYNDILEGILAVEIHRIMDLELLLDENETVTNQENSKLKKYYQLNIKYSVKIVKNYIKLIMKHGIGTGIIQKNMSLFQEIYEHMAALSEEMSGSHHYKDEAEKLNGILTLIELRVLEQCGLKRISDSNSNSNNSRRNLLKNYAILKSMGLNFAKFTHNQQSMILENGFLSKIANIADAVKSELVLNPRNIDELTTLYLVVPQSIKAGLGIAGYRTWELDTFQIILQSVDGSLACYCVTQSYLYLKKTGIYPEEKLYKICKKMIEIGSRLNRTENNSRENGASLSCLTKVSQFNIKFFIAAMCKELSETYLSSLLGLGFQCHLIPYTYIYSRLKTNNRYFSKCQDICLILNQTLIACAKQLGSLYSSSRSASAPAPASAPVNIREVMNDLDLLHELTKVKFPPKVVEKTNLAITKLLNITLNSYMASQSSFNLMKNQGDGSNNPANDKHTAEIIGLLLSIKNELAENNANVTASQIDNTNIEHLSKIESNYLQLIEYLKHRFLQLLSNGNRIGNNIPSNNGYPNGENINGLKSDLEMLASVFIYIINNNKNWLVLESVLQTLISLLLQTSELESNNDTNNRIQETINHICSTNKEFELIVSNYLGESKPVSY